MGAAPCCGTQSSRSRAPPPETAPQLLDGNKYLLTALGSGLWPVMVLLSEVVQTVILADFWCDDCGDYGPCRRQLCRQGCGAGAGGRQAGKGAQQRAAPATQPNEAVLVTPSTRNPYMLTDSILDVANNSILSQLLLREVIRRRHRHPAPARRHRLRRRSPELVPCW
jgi:hypothetical protein